MKNTSLSDSHGSLQAWRSFLAHTIIAACLTLAMPLLGQVKKPKEPDSARPLGTPPAPALEWQAVAQDWHSTKWQAVQFVTNEVTGGFKEELRTYTSIGNGQNYLDDAGQWQVSKDVIEISTNGAVAKRGPTKVWFAPDLAGKESVTIQTRSNNVIRLKLLGLFYFDAQSGESVQIASVRESAEGELVPPNTVIYSSVLNELHADLRLTWTRGAFESDLILMEQPQPPAYYKLNDATTRLELWHSFDSDSEPRRTQMVLEREEGALVRAGMAEPDLVEETLDFGDLAFPRGYAFVLNGPDAKMNTNATTRIPGRTGGGWAARGDGRDGRVSVAKRLVRIGERSGLVESVPWQRVRSQLETLPAARRGANLITPPQEPRRKGRWLPTPNEMASSTLRPMQVAAAAYAPKGFCWDYNTETIAGDFTFQAGQTYNVESDTTFTGLVGFNAGAVLKYGPQARITVGTPTFPQPYEARVVFTTKDDNSCGVVVAGSTGRPVISYNQFALSVLSLSDITLSNLEFRWFGTCVDVYDAPTTYTINNCVFLHSYFGIMAFFGCHVAIQNSTYCDLISGFVPYNGATVSGSLTESCPATLGEAVDQPGWAFDSWGGYPAWAYQSATTWDGVDAARSGAITHSQSTHMRATGITGPGTISFHWRVSSEDRYDYLRFFVDGAEQAKICGERSWEAISFLVPGGAHNFEWQYTKDSTVTAGSDAGWVDNVQFTPGPGPVSLAEALDNTSLPLSTNGNAIWYGQTTTSMFGGDAAKSGDIGHSQTSDLESTITGPGSVSFYWRVSSEPNHDFLNFYIDGALQAGISGEAAWVEVTYPLSPGSHTLKWQYATDSSGSTGADAGWVDYVRFTPAGVGPTIQTQPQSQTVAAGNSATFSVNASGSSPLSYQWNFNGNPIIGATTNAYTISSAQPAHAGSYAVTVSNPYGTIPSSSASLTVTASTCYPPPTGIVGWWPGDGNGTNLVNTNYATLQSGATYAQAMVGYGFSLDGSGAHAVVAANPNINVGPGPGLTLEAWIKRMDDNQRPIFEFSSPSFCGTHMWVNYPSAGALYVNLTDTSGITHAISADNVVPTQIPTHVAVTYDRSSGWAKLFVDGQQKASVNLGIFVPRTSDSLYMGYRPLYGREKFYGWIDEPSLYGIALSQTAIQGIYQAGASGKCRPNSVIAPSITTQPTNQTVYSGSNVTFAVVASGSAPLSYQWRFNGGNILGATSSSYTNNNVQVGSAGNYSVFISNAGGSVTSSVAVLTVRDANDPDYDGIPTWIEQQEGTLPTDAASGRQVRLGHWRFFDSTFSGEENLLYSGDPRPAPSNLANVQFVSSGFTNAARVNSGSVAHLQFRDVEFDGTPNINCRAGTVRFWFMPEWSSMGAGGSGPGVAGQLIQVGSGWVLGLNSQGNTLTFNTVPGVTLLSASVSWTNGQWHNITLTYGPNATALYIDGVLATNGAAVTNYPDAAARTVSGLNIGTDTSGTLQAKGQFDEIETFNYQLPANDITEAYLLGDTDSDGLPDWWELKIFGNLSQTTSGDPDNDGISNWLEYLQGRNPMVWNSGVTTLEIFTPLK